MQDETVPNNEQRIKRGLFLSYLGVDYEVFCMGDDFEPQEFKELMKEIQVEEFEPEYFNK